MSSRNTHRKPVVYYGDAAKVGQRIPITVKKKLAAEEEECNVHVPFIRILTLDGTTRSLEYRRRKFEWKEPLHWGQLKLFTSELEFLTMYSHLSNIIVYAGAADGRHIPFLANIFKNHKFVLWDPVPLYEGYANMPNIEFHQELFTDETALAVSEKYKKILFISDIRSMPDDFDYGNMTPNLDEEVEEDVKRDMQLQKQWCEIMNPKACMLKFRLPYTPGKTVYLLGDVYFQAFAAETSSETRLIVSKKKHGFATCEYDHEAYENYMYRFNHCTRIQPLDAFAQSTYMENLVKKIKEAQALFNPIPLSYDVLALVYVIQKYLDVHDPESPPGEIIHHLTKYISSSFYRKYNNKKIVHEKHMAHNKARYENKEVL